MQDGKLGIGIIGLGGISFAHEAGYTEMSDRCQITAMCDLDPLTLRDRAAISDAHTYADFNDLVKDPMVDMVDIILPHHLHKSAAMAAFAAGKHVLIEKPIALNPEDARQMIAAAKGQKRKFSVAENTRFVAAYRQAEKVLAEGKLGNVRMVKTLISGSEVGRLKDASLWKGRMAGSGGGVIMDCGPHSFYLIKWLFGKVKSLRAHASHITPGCEVEDHATLTGYLENGAEFVTEFSFIAECPWRERLEVFGTEGALLIDMMVNPTAILFNGTEDYDGTPLAVDYEPAGWKYLSIVEEVKSFVADVLDDRTPAVDPEDCAYGLEVIQAAYQSLRTRDFINVAH